MRIWFATKSFAQGRVIWFYQITNGEVPDTFPQSTPLWRGPYHDREAAEMAAYGEAGFQESEHTNDVLED